MLPIIEHSFVNVKIYFLLYSSRMPQKFECILYVPGHRPVSLHRIRRRIGLKMCFFCYHHSDACGTSPHGGCLQFGHRYSRNCHFHCFTRKNKRAAHRPPNIISIAQKLWKCLFSFSRNPAHFLMEHPILKSWRICVNMKIQKRSESNVLSKLPNL